MCVTNHSIKNVNNIYIYFYLHVNFNILIAGQQHFFWSFYLPFPTRHSIFCNASVVMCTCCGTNLFHNCTFLSRGFHSIKKTHPIVYKGSCLHFAKVHIFLFYKYHTQVSAVLQEHHLFHKGSAVLSFHTLTQNPSISANFTLFVTPNRI